MNTFLQPLSKEEDRECLEARGGSDGVKAREAKQKLIERNLRLVAHIAKKYQNVDEDMEDLISIGTIGLIKAVDSFDSAKNSKLATYAASKESTALISPMVPIEIRSSMSSSTF